MYSQSHKQIEILLININDKCICQATNDISLAILFGWNF